MTLYWWTHWFWITSTAGVLLEILGLIATIETYPLSPPFINKEYSKKDKMLKFPLAAQLDVDDVFTAGGDPMSAAIRDKKVISNKHNGIIKKPSISDTVVNQSVNDSITSQVSEEIQNRSNVSLIANRTKGDDEPFSNNSLSTLSSVEHVTATSSQNGTSDSLPEDNNSASTSPLQDHSEIINCTHTNPGESTKESSVSQTSNAVDFVDEVKPPNDKSHVLEDPINDDESTETENDHQLGERGRKSKVLTEYSHELKDINFSSDAKNLLARSAAVSLDLDEQDDGNVSSEALSIERSYILDPGIITGLCFLGLVVFSAAILIGLTLYRRQYLNKPQTLSEPDSSAYIDDSTMRDNSDEMYSLDNDSFLNSLEAMTIQNYWTDTVKHTKL